MVGRPRKEGVVRDADGRFRVWIYCETRKRSIARGMYTDPAAAHLAYAQHLDGAAKREHQANGSGDMLVRTILDAYEAQHGPNCAGWARAGTYRLQPLRTFFGDRLVSSLRPTDRQAYFRARMQGLVNGRAARASTVDGEIKRLNTAIRWARQNLGLPETKATTIPAERGRAGRNNRLVRAERRAVDFLLPEDAELVLAKAAALSEGLARPHPLHLFVWLGLHTGARKSWIEALRPHHIDLVEGYVRYERVRDDLADVMDRSDFVQSKNQTSVPIRDRLRPLLTWAVETCDDGWLLGAAPKAGGPRDIRSQFDAWRDTFWTPDRTAGRPTLTRHRLRHTFASALAQRGVPLPVVARLIGDTIETTQRYYVGADVRDLKSVIEEG